MLLKTKIEIEEWLNKYEIQNYELIEDKDYGYVVNVSSYVHLCNKNLTSIDVKFNIVEGWFDCGDNELTSLKGCPKIVNVFLNCSNNKLTSLIGCSEIVNGHINCSENELISLEGLPKKILKDINLSKNKLVFKELRILNSIKGKKFINIDRNENLGELQKINDFNEFKIMLKRILKIYQEKENLDKLLMNKKILEKSVKNTEIIKTLEVKNKI